jgi:tetratricopeptide (TPR) repeat protein
MMQLLQFVLRHLVLALLLLYALIGFMYRQAIFNLSVTAPQTSPALPATPQPGHPEVVSVPTVAPNPDPLSVVPPAVPPAKPEQAGIVPAESAYHFRPEADLPGPPPVPVPDYPALLAKVRALVTEGDLKAGEASYRDLIDRYPDNPEPYGELGNLYLQLQDQDKAAEAYLQAGLRIDPKEQPGRIAGLLKALEQLAPDKADQLRRRHLLDESWIRPAPDGGTH